MVDRSTLQIGVFGPSGPDGGATLDDAERFVGLPFLCEIPFVALRAHLGSDVQDSKRAKSRQIGER